MEITQVFINSWMDKEETIHTYDGILGSHKKEWNNTTCTNMDGPTDYDTKWSKSDRQKQITWCHLYVESEKSDISESIYETETHRHRKQSGIKGERSRDG